jgi:hypothetical protein
MTVFDIDTYKAELRLETNEQLKFLLGQVGRNGESDWTLACERAIQDELAARQEAANQPNFL